MPYGPTASVLGLDGPDHRRRVYVRGGDKVRGDVLMFDLPGGDEATTDIEVASKSSSLVNVVAPTTAQLTHGIFGVLHKDTTDDRPGYVALGGFVMAYLIKSSGNINAGDLLVPTTAMNLSPDGTLGHKAVAFFAPLDGATMVAPTTRTLGRVYFSGVNPIGAHAG